MTPYQMACKTADYLGLDKALINRVTAADFSQPAKRPAKTGFNIDKARTELDFEPISFEEGIEENVFLMSEITGPLFILMRFCKYFFAGHNGDCN